MKPATNAADGHAAPGRWEKVFLVVIVAAIGVLAYVATIPGGHRAPRSLYITAAQVIPVLIIALAVDQVWRPIWTDWRHRKRVIRFVLMVVLAGETAAMLMTAYDVDKSPSGFEILSSRLVSDLMEWITVVALGVGLLAVLWGTWFLLDVAAAGRAPDSETKHSANSSRFAWLLVLLLCLRRRR